MTSMPQLTFYSKLPLNLILESIVIIKCQQFSFFSELNFTSNSLPYLLVTDNIIFILGTLGAKIITSSAYPIIPTKIFPK